MIDCIVAHYRSVFSWLIKLSYILFVDKSRISYTPLRITQMNARSVDTGQIIDIVSRYIFTAVKWPAEYDMIILVLIYVITFSNCQTP